MEGESSVSTCTVCAEVNLGSGIKVAIGYLLKTTLNSSNSHKEHVS